MPGIRWAAPLPVSWLEMFSHFPRLTYFSFSFDFDEEGSDFNREFSHFPCLTSFSFEFMEEASDFNREFERWTDAVRTVRKQDPKALPFKCVELEPAIDISGCDPKSQKKMGIVQELRLPLKSLLIQVRSGMDEDGVRTILATQAETVKDIKVIGTKSAVLVQPFPFGVRLDHLESLEIKKSLCKNLAFLQFTPNLNLLIISGDEEQETNIISNSSKQEMGNVRMLHLEGLRLDGVVSEQDLAHLFEWIPAPQVLGMPLNDEQFGMVCEKLKTSLQSLSVQGDRLTDAGVTGMTIIPGEKEKKKKGGKKQQEGPEEVTQPNLTDLQNLLMITFSSSQLTDESVFHGFLKLPRLQTIRICSEDLRWGKEARKALKKRKISLEEPGCCGGFF